MVGIFSFRNSASLHSTFQGAWIFTNPTPWILVWKRRGVLRQCGQTRAEAILPSGPSDSLRHPSCPSRQGAESPPCRWRRELGRPGIREQRARRAWTEGPGSKHQGVSRSPPGQPGHTTQEAPLQHRARPVLPLKAPEEGPSCLPQLLGLQVSLSLLTPSPPSLPLSSHGLLPSVCLCFKPPSFLF